MQFYKIQGQLIARETIDSDKRVRRELARKITMRTAEFNGANNSEYCFLSDMGEEFVTIGIIATHSMNLGDFAEEYAKSVGENVNLELPEEITLSKLKDLLRNANRQCYINDDDEILERFGLDRLNNLNGFVFGENLINTAAKREELFAAAEKHFMNETMIPELERIYAGRKSHHTAGHPVHYIVEEDDHDIRREVYKILLDALYANLRLGSCRYSFVDFRPGECYSRMSYESLYKISEGGAVIVRYNVGDGSENDDNVSSEFEVIENICDMAKRYRNKVLTVLCFPRECKKVKAQFYEHLGTMAFVELREDFIDADSAKKFLVSLASKNHARADKELCGDINDDRTYLTAELQTMFDEWYNQKLKNTVYPQYKDIAVVRVETVKSKPKGSAYDELMQMIGLAEAKQVIKKAINYYKMQGLYEDKGVKRDNPAMHMIFSGNPGTAKTTVARLFARIMRENGLLSRGQLVEVGRGDLVGKYAGWTAQVVKEKFKTASGGVLFIDEAYSLVDDRDGSYGDEAINTIVQEMENHRADIIVIFAGYPDKMEGFLGKNPGLRSRIAFHVPFADYSSEELCQIADMISKRNGMKIEKDALDKLEKVFALAKADNDFGNGRYVRNIFEQAKMNQASRLLEKNFDDITSDDITTITVDDIIIPAATKPQKRPIGFC